MTTTAVARALLNRRHHMGLVVTVLVSAHQEFLASQEVLDLLDLQDHPAIMEPKDPWAQEETGEIKALKDHQDQPVHLETRVTQGRMEAKVPQAPRDLKDPRVKQVPQEIKVMQVLVEAKVPQVPRELLDLWDVTGNSAFLRILIAKRTLD